jgi:hypoxanthine phosphoribosyltransferase
VSEPRLLFTSEEVAATVGRLGAELSAAYPDGMVLVAVLKGSVWFLADLLRRIVVPTEVDFLAISSYAPDTGRVRILKDLDGDILGRPVVLVEDIVDTGLTLTYVLGELARRQPESLEVCALLDKATRRIVPTPVRFCGFRIEDEFALGYGLDYAGLYRNVPAIVAGDLDSLRADPTTHVQALYAG